MRKRLYSVALTQDPWSAIRSARSKLNGRRSLPPRLRCSWIAWQMMSPPKNRTPLPTMFVASGRAARARSYLSILYLSQDNG